jgi:hypothetical protein
LVQGAARQQVWRAVTLAAEEESDTRIVKEANGNVLADGDTAILIKDLKVKVSSTTLKGGRQDQEHPLGVGRTRGGLQDRQGPLHAEGLLPEKS